MIFTKTPETDIPKLLKFIRTQLPLAEVKSESSTSVAFRTPFSTFENIAPILEQLDRERYAYGVEGFGVGQNSLRDNYAR